MKRSKWVVLLLAMLIVLSACSAKTARNSSPAAQSAPSMENSKSSQDIKQDRVETRKIIMNASVALRVEDIAESLNSVEALTKVVGGYTKDSYLDESNGRLSSMIPAENLDNFLDELGKLGKVISRNKTSEDVTDTYFDTQIRIKNLETEIDTMRKLQQKEGWKVSELLEIEREIRRLTDELELLKGQITNLDRNIKYSQVDIRFVAEGTNIQTGNKEDFGYRIRTAFLGGVHLIVVLATAFASLIVFAIPVLPVVLVLYIIWRKLIRPYLSRKNKDMGA